MAITAKVNTPPDANGKVTNSSASKTVGTQNASKVLDNFTIKASDIPITLDNSSAANVRDALNESVLITTTQTLTNKTLTSPVINTGISGTAILDEDNMASNSNTKLATQQSIKSYVDTSVNTELVQDIVGAMFTSNTETNIDVEYQDGDGTIDLVATGSIDLTGTIAGNDFARFTDTNTLQGLSVAETKSALGISDNEIIDWTSDQGSTNIHAGNYTDTNTTYSVQDGELSQNNFTNADHTKLNSIEASADITDTANVTSVGALMDSEVTNLAQVKAFDSSDYLASSVTTISGGQASAITANTAKTGITSGQASAIIANTAKISYNSTASNKLGTIEENADVTDTANVTSSGALMDSELTSIANVKALNQSVISGASPTFGTANMSDASNKRLMTNAQETKLDSVETDADVTDTANVTSSGALMDSELAGIAAIKATTGTFLLADESKLDGIEASATADQSNSEIRALVESASDSNVFTDTDHSKLNAIAASANNYTLPLLDEDNMASDSATSVPSQQSVKAYVNSIVDSAPGTLDTLNELAAALGDNPNYATTTAADIATRAIKTNNLSDLANAGTARTNLGLGALAVLGTVNAATITDNSVGADELNVSGDGSSANFLRSDGDGTFTWATPTDTNTQLSTAQVQTIVGAMFSSNTETRIGVTYQSGDGTIDLVVDDMTANTNTQLSTEQVQDIAGPLVATNGTKTGIAVTYDDVNGDMDFVVDHDAATNFVANEHIDWTGASAGTIHASNYTNTGNTTYTAGTGLDLSGTTFNIAYSGFSAIQESAANDTFITFDTSGSNAIKIAELSDIIGLVNHDSITGFVANEHIDHTSVSITAGSGLAGGGTIAANRTLNIGAGTGILVHSDTIAVDHLPATDDRDVKPSAITTSGKYQVRAYFTSLEGLTGTAGSDWQDLLVLDTYSDGTGGDMNALAFDKSTQNIYHYLADQGASTWGTAKRLAYIENGSNNRVMTASSSSTVNGEGNLTFDGTDLKLLGDDLEMRWGTDGDFKIYVSSDDAYLKNVTQDKDIRFQVNDGGSNITAIKIDASDAGTATFSHDIRLNTELGAIRFGATQQGSIYEHASDIIISNSAAGNDTVFENLSSDGSSYVKNFFIDGSTSRVGIGTTSPSKKFVVKGASGDIARFEHNAAVGAVDIYSGTDGGLLNVRNASGTSILELDGRSTAGASKLGAAVATTLTLPASHSEAKIVMYSGGNEKIGTAANTLIFTAANHQFKGTGQVGTLHFLPRTGDNRKTSIISAEPYDESREDVMMMVLDAQTGVNELAIGSNTSSYESPNTITFYTASAPDSATNVAHFKIDTDGTLTGTDTSIGSNSDKRLKKDIKDFDNGLELVCKLKPRTFKWREPEIHFEGVRRGFIAQEIKEVDEYWVDTKDIKSDTADYKHVSDTNGESFVSKLSDKDAMYVSAIQELKREIDELKLKLGE